MFIDGKSVVHATGLVLRTEEGPDGRVQGLHFQTFFGGQSHWFSVFFALTPYLRTYAGLGITARPEGVVRGCYRRHYLMIHHAQGEGDR